MHDRLAPIEARLKFHNGAQLEGFTCTSESCAGLNPG